jgi:translocation and assembly module TamA
MEAIERLLSRPRLGWTDLGKGVMNGLAGKLSVVAMIFVGAAGSGRAEPEEPQTEQQKLCGSVIVEYDYDLTFTATEKRLLCGSPGVQAWEHIPLRQAQFHMTNFLAARGYHNPLFKLSGETLFVKPGLPTLIKSLRLIPDLPELGVQNFWLPRGRPLTPDELNAIEQWASSKLGREGYPCAEVQTRGDPDTGEVEILVDKGPLWTIREVKSEPIPGVRGGMLDRYRAFYIGERYDSSLLDVSAERLKASQVVVNALYRPLCKGEPGVIEQRTLAGKPRLVSFGIGFDSENLFQVKAEWRNSRWSESASLLDLSSLLSYHNQRLLGTFDWYYLPVPSQHYLKTYMRVQREFEKRFEAQSIKASIAPAFAGDVWGIRGDIYAGPSLLFENTLRGEGPRNARLLTLDVGIAGQSNLYEYFNYLAAPQTGYSFNLFVSTSDKGLASNVSATTYSADFTRLWNLLSLEPEIWIFGIRGSFATTRPGRDTDPEDLPPSFKYALGGSSDLRGFGRKALPTSGSGALTKAYLGSELRLNNSLPHQLQPFVFADWGKLGEEALDLDSTLFWSPGLGLRWGSPIGVLRFMFGHGFVSGPEKEQYEGAAALQFYVSIGEQF